MSTHFYGEGWHYSNTIDIKDMTLFQKAYSLLLFFTIVVAIASGLAGHVYMVPFWAGVFLVMIGFCAKVFFGVPLSRLKFMYTFICLGIAAILVGLYGTFVGFTAKSAAICIITGYIALWLTLGIVMLVLSDQRRTLKKRCTKQVEARCTIADVVRTNVFRSDDVSATMNADINKSTLCKPAFEFVLNGETHYVESTVYYGDLNQGFEEGAMIELWVNPDDPNEVIPKKTTNTMILVFGICCFIAALIPICVLPLISGMIF